MQFNLTKEQSQVHERALAIKRDYDKLEWQMIESLQEIDRLKIFKYLGFPSLFQYAVQGLGFSESVAYSFINVARKAAIVVELKEALRAKVLSVSKASRTVSAMTNENAAELIGFAKAHSSREIDFEVARINPKVTSKERVKPVSEDTVEIRVCVSRATFEKLNRAKDLASSKARKAMDLGATIDAMVDDYLRRQDPVHKAMRSSQRSAAPRGREQRHPPKQNCKQNPRPESLLCPSRVPLRIRKPLSARQKHQVIARDEGRCTFRDMSGQRCTSERWLHTHHILEVSKGGTNDPENITTLCWQHHDLTHQLSLPIEGQVTWVRSPQTPYGGMLFGRSAGYHGAGGP